MEKLLEKDLEAVAVRQSYEQNSSTKPKAVGGGEEMDFELYTKDGPITVSCLSTDDVLETVYEAMGSRGGWLVMFGSEPITAGTFELHGVSCGGRLSVVENGPDPAEVCLKLGIPDIDHRYNKNHYSEQTVLMHNIEKSCKGSYQQTPLSTAPYLQNAKLLIAAKADVNLDAPYTCGDQRNKTALIVAAEASTNVYSYFQDRSTLTRDMGGKFTKAECDARVEEIADLIEELLEAGADVNAMDSCGKTPLMYGMSSLRIVKTLLSAKADVNLCGSRRDTIPVHIACSTEQWGDALGLILEAKADPNHQGASDALMQPLHRLLAERLCLSDAAKMDCEKTARNIAMLLEAKADVNAASGRLGLSPLHLACQMNLSDATGAVQVLLDAKAEVNMQTAEGMTPLDIICGRKSREVWKQPQVETLLEQHGAIHGPQSPQSGNGGCVLM